MGTMRLAELRRALGRALLAAPLLVACSSSPPSSSKAGPSDAAAVTSRPADATPVGQCRHDPPNITGCGGAEVVLHDSLASCNLPADGELPKDRCDELCATFDTRSCRVFKNRDGQPGVFCDAANPCMGRTPSSGALAGTGHADALLDHLALARRMEALSVAAFRELEDDLRRWGAPASLRRACRRAARDEARHARSMARLLRDRGVVPERLAPARPGGFASLLALALHNEREGVVGETWGALIARYQAEHAVDDDVRAAMRAIAEEETRHAALSFEIAAWARQQLSAEEARSLDDARRGALAELRDSGGARPGDDAADRLGWPSPSASGAMLGALAPLLAA